MSYLRNCWYLAAWQDEISGSGTVTRIILGDPVVLFANEHGETKALLDRCPHRFAPLSSGSLQEGSLTCRYHGLAFDGTGACVTNPHGPILKSMTVRAYPTMTAYRGVWIWMGDPELADPALLPDLSFVDRTPETAFSNGYVCGNGDYRLFVDNIMDLTHADYLHPTTLGGGSWTQTPGKVTDNGSSVKIHWDSKNNVPFPLIAKALKIGKQPVDSFTEVEWFPASIMTLRTGSAPAGAPMSEAGTFLNLHIMTPEMPGRTHYFYASTRNFALDDVELNKMYSEARAQVFATEDKPMIELQQSRIGDNDFWDLKPILLRTDEGAVRVRRKLDEMIRREQIGQVRTA